MAKYFEEIDYQKTPLGDLTLSRRRIAMLGDREILEIKLNDEFLMSSLFFDSEVALANLGLAAVSGDALDVVVGGLGLGFTAAAALADPRVRSLAVVDFLEAVIGWHRAGLIPLGVQLNKDPRCAYVHGDFFALARGEPRGFDPAGKLFHAILLDIDHSPTHFLNETNRPFYEVEGLRKMSEQLHPGGVFALWSNDPPTDIFLQRLRSVFTQVESHVIRFENPIQNAHSACTVYVAIKASALEEKT